MNMRKKITLACFLGLWAAFLFSGIFAPFNSMPIQVNLLFFIFTTSIVMIVLNVASLAPVCFTALGVVSFFKILPFSKVMSGFSNPTPWLIFFAFCFAKAFVKVGASQIFTHWLLSKAKGSTQGLVLRLTALEVMLAPFIPSNAARAGSGTVPVLKSLIESLQKKGPSASKTIYYIVLTAFCTNMLASALYLTGTAPNLLCVSLAREIVGLDISWIDWCVYMAIPCGIGLFIAPYIIRFSLNLGKGNIENISLESVEKLEPNRQFYALIVIFVLVLLLWVFGSCVGVSATQAAFMGVVCLLLTGVLSWTDIQENRPAWENFFWYAGFISLAGGLSDFKMFEALGDLLSQPLSGLGSVGCFILGSLIYAYVHYLFAGISPHVVSLLPVFLLIMVRQDVPSYIAIMSLSSLSVLSAVLTHFGSTATPLFFGLKAVPTSVWWKSGFLVGSFMFGLIILQGVIRMYLL